MHAKLPDQKPAFSRRHRSRARKAYTQALELQAILMDDARNEQTTAAARAQAARAWVDLEQQKRVILGLGAPKPVAAANDPTLQPAKRKARSQDSPSPDAPTPAA